MLFFNVKSNSGTPCWIKRRAYEKGSLKIDSKTSYQESNCIIMKNCGGEDEFSENIY